MQYKDARTLIHDGDILGVTYTGFFWSFVRLIQRIAGLGTYATVTHIGVAWWLEGRLYSVEMDGADNVLIPVSQLVASSSNIGIYRPPVSINLLAAQFERATSTPINYDYFDLLKIGIRLLFKTKPHADSNTNMVCSTFASRWLQWAGWVTPPQYPNLPSPGELARALGNPILEIN
jgi:hypothetical protein